jgi:hypothetical protein
VTIGARETEQARVEEIFAQSARVQDFRRRQQLASEWVDYHGRQRRSLESTLGDLVTRHQREEDRYRALLEGLGVPDDAA